MTVSVDTLAGYMADTAQAANGYSQYKVGEVTVTSNTTDTVVTLDFPSKMIGYISNDNTSQSLVGDVQVAFDVACGTTNKTFTIKSFEGISGVPLGGIQSIHFRNAVAGQSNIVRYFVIG